MSTRTERPDFGSPSGVPRWVFWAVPLTIVGVVLSIFIYKGLFGWPNERTDRQASLNSAERALEANDTAFQRNLANKYNLSKQKTADIVAVVKASAVNANAQGQVLSASNYSLILQTAVPDLNSLSIYDQLANDITAGTTSFASLATAVAEQANGFDAWHRKVPRSWFVGTATSQLTASGQTGEAALRIMLNPPMSEETRKTFQSGTFGGPGIPGVPTEAPAPVVTTPVATTPAPSAS